MLSSKISKFIFRKAFLFAITFLVVLSAISLATFTNILFGEDRPQQWSGIITTRWEKVHDFIDSWKKEWNSLETPWTLIVNWNLQVRWWSPAAWKVLQATDSSWNLERAIANSGSLWATWNWIEYIETWETAGLTTQYIIHYTNGNQYDYYVTNWADWSAWSPWAPWADWADWAPWAPWAPWTDWIDWATWANWATWNWISWINLIATGLIDTYRIYYTNWTQYDYFVTNGIKLESWTTNAIPVRRNNTLQISGTDMFNSGWNIGIGIENPANKLSVNWAINAISDINTETTYKIKWNDFWQFFINSTWTVWQVRKSDWDKRGYRWEENNTWDNLWNHTATKAINLWSNRMSWITGSQRIRLNNDLNISNGLNIRKANVIGPTINPLLIYIWNYIPLFKGATDWKVSIWGDTIDTDYQATINWDTRIQWSLLWWTMSEKVSWDIKLQNWIFTTYLNKHKNEINTWTENFGLIIDQESTDAWTSMWIWIKVIMDKLSNIAAIFMWKVGIKVSLPKVTLDVGWSIKISQETGIICNNYNRWEIRFDWACFRWCTYSWRQNLHTCNPPVSCWPNNWQTFNNLTWGNLNNCSWISATGINFTGNWMGRIWDCINKNWWSWAASCQARATPPSCWSYAGSWMKNLTFPSTAPPHPEFCNPWTFVTGWYNSWNNYRYRVCSLNSQYATCQSPHIINWYCGETAGTCNAWNSVYSWCSGNTQYRYCNWINSWNNSPLCSGYYSCSPTGE